MTTEELIAQPSRRRMLGLLGGFGAAVVAAACGDDGGSASLAPTTSSTATASTSTASTSSGATTTAAATSATTTAATTATATACTPIPEETAGPYPGDGTNGPNVLTQNGVVRRDIRSSIGSSSTVSGVPLTVVLKLVDKATCAARSGAAVYLWHCDQNGNYSMYSQGVTNETYLRGVQVSDSTGTVTFASIFPGAYSGRWPHIHFEVFASQARATVGTNKMATSQLALPDDICKTVYTLSGYESSARNHPQTTLRTDNVFSDGWDTQLATVTGNATAGYTATLVVAV